MVTATESAPDHEDTRDTMADLTDLIAAALYSVLAKSAKSGTATVDDLVASVTPVVEQHTNGRTAELREWQIKVATALGMCEEVMGIGYSIANAQDASERAESLTTLELEHIECPVWCYECERMERWQSCTHCNGSGCGPGTASGAYEECEWCAGDGRDHEPDLTARAEKAEATVARVEKALAEGPLHRIDFPSSKDPYGIERQTIRAALEVEQQ